MELGSASRHLVSVSVTWVAATALAAVLLTHGEDLEAVVVSILGMPQSGAASPGPQAEAETQSGKSGYAEIRAGRGGHFMTTAHLNGRPVQVMVDTGASVVALSYEDAERAGVFVRPGDFTHRVSTANGFARFAPVVLDTVSIGDIVVRNVQAAVSEPGRLQISLLGMTFLGRLSRTEMRSGVLVLEQ